MQELQETQVGSLGCKNLLKEEMATQSNILTWRTPWPEKPGKLHTVPEVTKSQTQLSIHTYISKGMTKQI